MELLVTLIITRSSDVSCSSLTFIINTSLGGGGGGFLVKYGLLFIFWIGFQRMVCVSTVYPSWWKV